MKKLWDTMHEYQDINIAKKGISFTEEKFTQLFDATVEASLRHIVEVRNSRIDGIFIGAAATGLVWLGAVGANKLRKRKLKVNKNEDIEEVLELQTFEPEVMEISDDVDSVKKISKKDRAALKNIINEINENKKE